MKEELVSFEVAKLAKEKGFNGKTIYHYDFSGFTCSGSGVALNWNMSLEPIYSKPAQGLLQKWLRDIHDINVAINYKPNIKKWDFIDYDLNLDGYGYVKYYKKYYKEYPDRRYDSYEEALEAGLFEALKLIK